MEVAIKPTKELINKDKTLYKKITINNQIYKRNQHLQEVHLN